MKLSSGGKAYPKFNAIGDTAQGTFVSFTEGMPGKFGPENVLLLLDGDEQQIRCPASLTKTIKANIAEFKPGVLVKITFTKSVPTTKGNPAKIFDVELFPAGTEIKHEATAKEKSGDPDWMRENGGADDAP